MEFYAEDHYNFLIFFLFSNKSEVMLRRRQSIGFDRQHRAAVFLFCKSGRGSHLCNFNQSTSTLLSKACRLERRGATCVSPRSAEPIRLSRFGSQSADSVQGVDEPNPNMMRGETNQEQEASCDVITAGGGDGIMMDVHRWNCSVSLVSSEE